MTDESRIQLNAGEEKERNDGRDLYAMTQTPGFQILKSRLEGMAYHSWIDPRETTDKNEFLWRELNGFHAANNAKELLEWIQEKISKAEYFEKKRKGELEIRSLAIK